jgi:K+-sensing histidine kinase KdpD
MDKTILEIPTELLEAAKITAEEAKSELAIRLYQLHKLNEDQARQLAGDPKVIEELVWNNNATGRVDLDNFLSWASHDLKSPLNTIIGFTRVVIKGIDGPLNEAQSADLTTAFTSSQRMLFFINNLVEMARLNIGHITIKRVGADMASLIKEVGEKWQVTTPAKKLTMDINLSQPAFSVDSVYIRNTISSLLGYAAIRVTEGSVSLVARDDESSLHVTIQSAGKKALDKSELDSAMFDFVCASLIKLHGGNMETPRETEDGLALVFSLPRT